MTVDNAQTENSIGRQLISMKDAGEILGISQRCLYRLIASGELPPPVKIGRASRMVLSEIDDYIEKIKTARSDASTQCSW